MHCCWFLTVGCRVPVIGGLKYDPVYKCSWNGALLFVKRYVFCSVKHQNKWTETAAFEIDQLWYTFYVIKNVRHNMYFNLLTLAELNIEPGLVKGVLRRLLQPLLLFFFVYFWPWKISQNLAEQQLHCKSRKKKSEKEINIHPKVAKDRQHGEVSTDQEVHTAVQWLPVIKTAQSSILQNINFADSKVENNNIVYSS